MKKQRKNLVYITLVIVLTLLLNACGSRKVILLDEQPILTGTRLSETFEMLMDDIEIIYSMEDESIVTNMTVSSNREQEKEFIDPVTTRIRIIEDKSQMTLSMAGESSVQPAEYDILHAKTIIRKRVGDDWEYSLEDGEVSEALADKFEELAKNKLRQDVLLPDGLIRVGQRWEVSPESVSELFGMDDIIDSSGSAHLRLKGITQYNGLECALIEVNMTMIADMIDETLGLANLELKVEGKIYRSLELMKNVGTKLTGDMVLVSEDNDTGMKITMKGPIIISSETNVREE